MHFDFHVGFWKVCVTYTVMLFGYGLLRFFDGDIPRPAAVACMVVAAVLAVAAYRRRDVIRKSTTYYGERRIRDARRREGNQ